MPNNVFTTAASAGEAVNALLAPNSGIQIDPNTLLLNASAADAVSLYDGSLTPLGIGAGLLMTSGTAPGTQNTVGWFGQDNTGYDSSGNPINYMNGSPTIDAVVNTVFQTTSFDASTLSFDFTVTDPKATSISFDVVFGSDEYPEWVDLFVDCAVVIVNGVNYALFNHDPNSPLSVIGSNLANGYFQDNAGNVLPIEYDGVSHVLKIIAPINNGGVNHIEIGIADTGDHIYDSGIFISNLAAGNTPGSGVVITPPDQCTDSPDTITGSIKDELIDLKGGDDIAYAGGGDDIVIGGLGNDTMYGGTGNDVLEGDEGDDTLDGGEGTSNEAVYSGNLADYSVQYNANTNTYTIADTNLSNGNDGVDQLKNIQLVKLGNTLYDLTANGLVAHTDGTGTPINLPGAVFISGIAMPGQTLTAIAADSNGIPDPTAVTFEWFVNNVSVLSGSSTYVPVESDAGKSITVTAQYQDALGNNETPQSNATLIAKANSGVLIQPMNINAPNGASVENPITTLLSNAFALGYTPNEASAAIKQVMGIDASIDLANYDAYAVLQADSTDITALAYLKILVEVAMTCSVSDPSGFNMTLAVMSAFNAGNTIDLLNTTDLQNMGVSVDAVSLVQGLNKDMNDAINYGKIVQVWNDWAGNQDNLKPFQNHLELISVHINQSPTGESTVQLTDAIANTDYVLNESDLLLGFTDPEKAQLSISQISLDQGGTVANNNDGTWTLTPDQNYTGPIEITYSVADPNGGFKAASQMLIVSAPALTNNAPTLTASSPALTTIKITDASINGQTVSSLLGTSLTDQDVGALAGIAVYDTAGSSGYWEYSTNGGVDWTTVGSVSATSALLLSDNDWVRWVPDGTNASIATISYYGWDQTTGSSGTLADVTTRGGSTAFSLISDTATLRASIDISKIGFHVDTMYAYGDNYLLTGWDAQSQKIGIAVLIDADGNLIQTFNGGAPISGPNALFPTGTILSDGSVLVQHEGIGSNAQLMKFAPDGTQDLTYTNNNSIPYHGSNYMLPDTSGGVYVAFYNSSVVQHFNADGTLDQSFGINGTLSLSPHMGFVGSMALNNGKLYVTGGSSSFQLQVFNTDGTPSNDFQGSNSISNVINGGYYVGGIGGEIGGASSIIFLPNNDFILLGGAPLSGHTAVTMAKYHADGTIDSSFGSGGVVQTGLSGIDLGVVSSGYHTGVYYDQNSIYVTANKNGSCYVVKYNLDGTVDQTVTDAINANLPPNLLREDGNAYRNYFISVQQDGDIFICTSTSQADFNLGQANSLNFAIFDSTGHLKQTEFSGQGNVSGSNAADVITGSGLDDTILGAGGNDELIGGAGNDTLNGGDGFDCANYELTTAGVIVNLQTGTAIGSEIGSDLLAQIEEACGGSGNDTLIAADTGSTLDGGAGNDLLVGGVGIDTANYADTSNNLVIDLAAGTATGNGTDTLQGIENATGGSGNDTMNAAVSGSVLDGGSGADILNGGAGNDELIGGAGNDILNGGDGFDCAEYFTTTAGVIVNLKTGIAVGSEIGTDTLILIEEACGGSGNDTLIAADTGSTLEGGGGSDTLNSGAGNDVLIGGLGVDTVDYSSTSTNVVIDLGLGTATGDGTDSLQGIENAVGGSGNDTMNAAASGSTLDGGGGADTLNGGVASDILLGGGGNDTINAGAGSDTITGGAGNDVIDGGAAVAPIALSGIALQSLASLGAAQAPAVDVNTVLYSGTRSQYSIVHNQNGSWTITDSVNGRDGIDTLTNIQRLQFTDQLYLLPTPINGTSGNDTIVGTVNDDIINGLGGIDTITGGAGIDTLLGGDGNDIYIMAAGSEHSAAEIQDSAGTADVIRFTSTTANDTLTLFAGDTGIEQVFIGDATGVTTGTTALNVDATLVTTALSMTGNAGNNRLIGGLGVDSLVGGLGNDTYGVNLTGSGTLQDTVTEAANAGTDTLLLMGSYGGAGATITLATNLENLDASNTGSSILNLTGNTVANTLIGNDANNILNGGVGADRMEGGAGNDTYTVDNVGDVLVEALNAGIDLVNSSVTYTLQSNIENLTLTGTTAINATGNDLNNTLIGNTAINIITGGAGTDTMNGAAGNDIYIIAAGSEHLAAEIQDSAGTADVIRFTSTTANDTLTLFAGDTGVEQVVIGTATGATTGTTALNVDASLVTTALSITGNAGNNRLTGGTAVDTLIGGAGNDTYVVNVTNTGTIQDTITEAANAGTDTVVLKGSYVGAGATITLAANLENIDISNTGSSILNLTGNTLANTLIGNNANNILNGGTGADRMEGGAGNDTYTVDNVGDVLVEALNAGIDLVNSSIAYTLLANFENLTLTGATAINGTGNSSDNVITGNTGNNTLFGLGGNDTLSGGNGNDRLEGGVGNDILTGGAGNDNFVFNTLFNGLTNVDTLTDFKTSGTDRIMLSKSIFAGLASATPTAAGVALTASDFVSGTSINETSSTGQHLLYNSSTGYLYYDPDGQGGLSAVKIGLIGETSHPSLLATDFLVIS